LLYLQESIYSRIKTKTENTYYNYVYDDSDNDNIDEYYHGIMPYDIQKKMSPYTWNVCTGYSSFRTIRRNGKTSVDWTEY